MAALVCVAALFGTRSAAQRLLEPRDRGMLRPEHDREVDRRVRFAAGAFHLEETEAGIQRVAKSRRRLRRGRRIASRDRVGLRPRRDWCLERNKTWFGSSQICLTSHAIVSRWEVA